MSIAQNSCGAGNLSLEDLIRAATGTDADGQPILRLIHVVDSGNFFSCTNQGAVIEPAAYFGLNEEGNIALRVNISNLA